MTSYLLDTNVIAALSPRVGRSSAEQAVAAWLERSEDLWLSVITAAEVADGIAKATRTGASRKAQELAEWWAVTEHYYGARMIPLDRDIAHIAGALMDVARAAGITPGFEDVAIAATAKYRGFVVLTRNTKDFEPLGVPNINPFKALPFAENGRQ